MWVWLAVEALLGCLAAGLAAGAPARRRAARWLSLGGLLLPLGLRDAPPLAAFVSALFSLLIAVRTFELAADLAPRTLGARLWHVWGVFDTRLARRIAPYADGRLFAQAAAWAALAALGLWLGLTREHALRWLGGAAFTVATFEFASRGARAAYRLGGIEPPPLHDRPYLSRTVAEFWGTRWNKVVGRWLRVNLYAPWARRGRAQTGRLLAFGASAGFHAYLVAWALGWWWAAVLASFFLLQLALLAAERALHVRRWPPTAAHAWTVLAIGLASPLFSEPVLHLFTS